MSQRTLKAAAVWDAIERVIDAAPTGGINAQGRFHWSTAGYQRGYIDGLRAARLTAMTAIDDDEPIEDGDEPIEPAPGTLNWNFDYK